MEAAGTVQPTQEVVSVTIPAAYVSRFREETLSALAGNQYLGGWR
jgi:hypothetical protein